MPRGLSRSRIPRTSLPRTRGASMATPLLAALACGARFLVDEPAELGPAARARVVAEAQLGDAPQLQRLPDARAEEAARFLESFFHVRRIVIERDRIEEDRCDTKVAAHVDRAHARSRQSGILDLA